MNEFSNIRRKKAAICTQTGKFESALLYFPFPEILARQTSERLETNARGNLIPNSIPLIDRTNARGMTAVVARAADYYFRQPRFGNERATISKTNNQRQMLRRVRLFSPYHKASRASLRSFPAM